MEENKDLVIKQEFFIEYICFVCQVKFLDENELEEHSKTHDGTEDQNMPTEIVDIKEERPEETEDPTKKEKVKRKRKQKLRFVCPKKYKSEILKSAATEPPKYVCDLCQKVLKNKASFNYHLSTHKKKGKKCKICGEVFDYRHQFLDHMHSHKQTILYHCPKCCHTSTDRYQYNCHQKKVHPEKKPYKCYVCEETKGFTNIGKLKIHQMKVHALNTTKKTLSCDLCIYTTLTRKKLIIHYDFVHRIETPFKCGLCIKPVFFKNRGNLTKHFEESHVTIHPFKCSYCSDTFTNDRNLQKHEKWHTTIHQCIICGKNYRNFDNFHKHTMICTGESNPVAEFHYEKPKKKLYECDNCGETFKLKAELVKHIKTHRKKPLDQPKPKPTFKCHHCPEVYSDEEKLFDHIDSDHVKKTYKCRFCSYTTLRSYCMKSHQLVHSNYRPFKCVKCDKGFKSQYCLNRHEAIVHSNKRHKCTECPSQFKNITDYRKHMGTHGKSVIYPCEHCSEVFKTITLLKIHTGKRHISQQAQLSDTIIVNSQEFSNLTYQIQQSASQFSIKVHQCQVCFKHFMTANDLSYHMDNVHAPVITEVVEIWQCDICSDFFAKEDMENHLLFAHVEIKSEIEVENPIIL